MIFKVKKYFFVVFGMSLDSLIFVKEKENF